MIVDENTPLVLYTGYEDGAADDSDYASAQMGIYSLKDRKWIVEPARQSGNLFHLLKSHRIARSKHSHFPES